MDVVSLAAEFPNDNPELHRGVSWVCLDVTGAPTLYKPFDPHQLRQFVATFVGDRAASE